ncbi:MAG: isoprenylcysteine carboxylmethyltransferase family protein [Clostridium sp.]|nr:isoprenylcysteine carboxylmethyltransferase family protein [Clostridium sp.]
MKQKDHLPLMGVGPIYVCGIITLTIIGIVLKHFKVIKSGTVDFLKIPFFIVGIVLIIVGLLFWYKALFQSKVDENIRSNTLMTTGVYSYVRNPIYSAFMMICTGVLFCVNNLWLLILPFIYWFFMTILMKNTEEKWLKELYKEKYLDYCKRVNRCIPWFH